MYMRIAEMAVVCVAAECCALIKNKERKKERKYLLRPSDIPVFTVIFMSNFNLQIPSLLFLPSNSIACKFHPLQCLNKTLLYCDNLPTNYTCPPFFGPVSVVLHFQVLHFHALTFGPAFSGPAFSCPDIWSCIFRSCIFIP